jgi:hypothetical protein
MVLFVGILEVTAEKSQIRIRSKTRIRTKMSWIWNTADLYVLESK